MNIKLPTNYKVNVSKKIKAPKIISIKFNTSYVKIHTFDMSQFKMPYSKENRILYPEVERKIENDMDLFNKLVCDSQYYIYRTNKIIKRLATSKYSCAGTCLTLVTNNYKDDIMLDLYNEMYITMLELYNTGLLTIKDDILKFNTYINKKGNEVTSYFKLYKAIADYLEKQKVKADKTQVSMDLLYFDNDDNERTLNFKSTQYLNRMIENSSDIDIKDIIYRTDIQSYMLYVKKEYPKMYTNYLTTLIALIEGYNQTEIAEILKVSQKTISVYLRVLRKSYKAWNNDNKKLNIHHISESNYGKYNYDYDSIDNSDNKDNKTINDIHNINTYNDNYDVDTVYLENCINDFIVSNSSNTLPAYMIKDASNKYELSYKLVRYNIEVYSDDKLLHTVKISKRAYNTLKHNVNANMIFTK